MAVDAVLVGTKTSGTGNLTTGAGTTTSGSTFVVFVSYDAGATLLTVTDSKLNVYTLIDDESSNGHIKAIYRSENGTGGASHTATVTFTGSSNGTAYLVEATGAAAASFDQTAVAIDSTEPFTVTLPTLSQADEVILSICGNATGGAQVYVSSNTTIIGSELDGNTYWTSAISKTVVASTAAFTPSWTSDADLSPHTIMAATFKQAAAGGDVLQAQICM